MGTSNFFYRDSLYAHNDFDEFGYDCLKEDIKAFAEHYDKTKKPSCRIVIGKHRDLDYFNDRNFSGPVLINVYYPIEIEHEYGEISLGLLDENFGLRNGYYEGYNFDREGCGAYDASEEDIKTLKDDLYDRIYNYDELDLEEYCEELGLSLEAEKDKVYKEICADIDKAVKEMDELFHAIGETFFDEYRTFARFSNGETWYEKIA